MRKVSEYLRVCGKHIYIYILNDFFIIENNVVLVFFSLNFKTILLYYEKKKTNRFSHSTAQTICLQYYICLTCDIYFFHL